MSVDLIELKFKILKLPYIKISDTELMSWLKDINKEAALPYLKQLNPNNVYYSEHIFTECHKLRRFIFFKGDYKYSIVLIEDEKYNSLTYKHPKLQSFAYRHVICSNIIHINDHYSNIDNGCCYDEDNYDEELLVRINTPDVIEQCIKKVQKEFPTAALFKFNKALIFKWNNKYLTLPLCKKHNKYIIESGVPRKKYIAITDYMLTLPDYD